MNSAQHIITMQASTKQRLGRKHMQCMVVCLSTLLVILISIETLQTLVHYRSSKHSCPICPLWNEPYNISDTILPQFNRTEANCSKSISLGQFVFVHVCLYQSNIIVDLRFFISGKASIKGIGLNTKQWTKLVDNTQSISRLVEVSSQPI